MTVICRDGQRAELDGFKPKSLIQLNPQLNNINSFPAIFLIGLTGLDYDGLRVNTNGLIGLLS